MVVVEAREQEHLETIIRYDRQYGALLNPRPDLLEAHLERSENEFLRVIREHSERLAHAWASPEKAWVDLYAEVENEAVPYHGELAYVLDELLEIGLVTPAKVRSISKRRGHKIRTQVDRFLPG